MTNIEVKRIFDYDNDYVNRRSAKCESSLLLELRLGSASVSVESSSLARLERWTEVVLDVVVR